MTRKDYIKIAAAIATVETMTEDIDVDGIGASTLRLVTAAIADALRDDNPRFDGARFEVAALPRQNERKVAAIKQALGMVAEDVKDEIRNS